MRHLGRREGYISRRNCAVASEALLRKQNKKKIAKKTGMRNNWPMGIRGGNDEVYHVGRVDLTNGSNTRAQFKLLLRCGVRCGGRYIPRGGSYIAGAGGEEPARYARGSSSSSKKRACVCVCWRSTQQGVLLLQGPEQKAHRHSYIYMYTCIYGGQMRGEE